MAHLEKAIFGLWGDITSSENRVPPTVTSIHLLRVPPSLPLWGDVIYGWSLTQFTFFHIQMIPLCFIRYKLRVVHIQYRNI